MGFWHSFKPPNERMQLTWLIGAPARPVSVHRRAVGRLGLGSPATQLMRAVSQPPAANVAWRTSRYRDTERHTMYLLKHWLASFRGGIMGLFLGMALAVVCLRQYVPVWGLAAVVAMMLLACALVGALWLVVIRRWLVRYVPADGVSRVGIFVRFMDYLVVVAGIVMLAFCYMYRL